MISHTACRYVGVDGLALGPNLAGNIPVQLSIISNTLPMSPSTTHTSRSISGAE
jgi:hypothetical protein